MGEGGDGRGRVGGEVVGEENEGADGGVRGAEGGRGAGEEVVGWEVESREEVLREVECVSRTLHRWGGCVAGRTT